MIVELVKDRPTRRVERLRGDDGSDLHRKTAILDRHPGRRLLALLGLGGLAREARNLKRAAALGVPVPRLAGMERGPGVPPRWMSLTTETLQGFAPVPADAGRDPEFARSLGRALGEWHAKGVLHLDLHPGNLLRSDAGEFAMLDGADLRIRRCLDSRDRRRGILVLLRGLRDLRASGSWEAFQDGYGPGLDSAGFRRIAAGAQGDLVRHLRRRSRRALRENPGFGAVRAGGLRWQARRGFVPPADPEEWLGSIANRVKSGGSSTVQWTPDGHVLKVFHPRPGLLRGLADLLRGSRAERAFQRGHLLELLGIPTPRVLAYAVAARFPRRGRSYLIAERFPGEQITAAWSRLSPEERSRALRDLGTVVGRLHRAGCSHRDLKGRNILWSKERGISILDMDGLRLRKIPLADAERMRDLARLARGAGEVAFHRRDALIWARSYAAAFGGGGAGNLVRLLAGLARDDS